MRTFIDDYLQNPSQAISDARKRAYSRFSGIDFPEDKIYAELSSPEFRLYEDIIFSRDAEPQIRDFAVA